MKVRVLIWALACVLCCQMLCAQARGGADAAPVRGMHRAPIMATLDTLSIEQVTVAPTNSGLLSDHSLYQQIYAPSPQVACLQLPARKTAQQNAFEQLDFHPAAIRSAFTHENLVKMAQNFNPSYRLPDAPPYTPLSTREKFDRFLRSAHSTDTWLGAVFDSLYSQATGAYPEFGGGMGGYGKRYGAAIAGAEAGNFFGRFLYPTLLHQDPRYFPSHQDGITNAAGLRCQPRAHHAQRRRPKRV